MRQRLNDVILWQMGPSHSSYFSLLGELDLKVFWSHQKFTRIFQTCSIGLTFYNRHLFHNFDIPIAATTCHFFITFALAGFSRKGRQCVTGHSSVLLDWKTFRNKIIPVGTTYSLHNKTVLKFLDRSYLSTRYRLIKLVIGVYNCSIVYDGEINFDIIYSILRSHSKTGEAALVFGYCHSSYINRTFYFWNRFKKILQKLLFFPTAFFV